MGDPNIVMLSMCAIDILCLILYFNIIKGVVADIKKNSKLAFNFSTGAFLAPLRILSLMPLTLSLSGSFRLSSNLAVSRFLVLLLDIGLRISIVGLDLAFFVGGRLDSLRSSAGTVAYIGVQHKLKNKTAKHALRTSRYIGKAAGAVVKTGWWFHD